MGAGGGEVLHQSRSKKTIKGLSSKGRKAQEQREQERKRKQQNGSWEAKG